MECLLLLRWSRVQWRAGFLTRCPLASSGPLRLDAIRVPVAGSALLTCLQMVYSGMADGTTGVRRAGCLLLSKLAQHCQPDVVQYHENVLPLLLQCLDDASSDVREGAGFALERFVEEMEEEIVEYLPILMERLNQMTQLGESLHECTRGRAVLRV